MLAKVQGDRRDALGYFLQALEIFERLHSPNRELTLRKIAKLRAEVGETAFAELWQEVRPGFPLPELPPVNEDPRQELLQRLVEFIEAQSSSEAQRLVEANPALLSDAAEALLGDLAAALEDAQVWELVEGYQALLRRCREVGIASAFAELLASQEQPTDDDLT